MLRKLTVAAIACVTVITLGLDAGAQNAQPAEEPVDINSATVEEITTVVEDAELAERIIEGRPWANKRQILTRELVSMEKYEQIRESIVARRIQAEP